MPSFEQALASLDENLFGHVPSQTTWADRLSLLALYNACHERFGEFDYLEIGSHLGGSLQVLIADPRCTSVTSIDSRPATQPHAGSEPVEYPDNSTARMLRFLELVPGADLGKLHTFDASTEQLAPEDVPAPPRLCFIDGEHTVAAALRDARFCRTVMADEGVIVFHDRRPVLPAIDTFVAELGAASQESFALRDRLFAVSFGEVQIRERAEAILAPHEDRLARMKGRPRLKAAAVESRLRE